jgi:hypothetical protein
LHPSPHRSLDGTSRPASPGPRITGQGVLTHDRTEFGSHYGSGKLFRFLGKHIVNDHIHLHVKIHAEREG